jgi:pyridoxine kinase
MPGPVLAISSQVAFAPVGNSAAVPALQAAGIEVLALPTIMLSNHPGLGTPSGIRMPAQTLTAMLEKLENLGALKNLSGIITGYFTDAEQVQAVAQYIARLKPNLYLCDPVLGDDPHGLYVAAPVAEAIRDHLLPLAHIITPNRFEREWLGPAGLKAAERITTSLPEGGKLITELVADGHTFRHETERQSGVPHGTGDLLSGLYLAARLHAKAPPQAFAQAMQKLESVITLSRGKPGLDLVAGLKP